MLYDYGRWCMQKGGKSAARRRLLTLICEPANKQNKEK